MATDPGPGIASTITALNLANWIPTVWATDIISEVESRLVLGSLVDRSYEKYAAYGNVIVVPRLSELSAQVVNFDEQSTTYRIEQNAENITLNQNFDVSVAMDDITKIQTNPKYFEKVRAKMAYALAKVIDINCANMLRGGNSGTKAGTTGSALTEDVLIGCYETLNGGDVPFEDRAWVLDTDSITDLMKLDFFIRMDYVPGSVVTQGFQGRQIFGAPVYMTTNLFAYTDGAHCAAYFQREHQALVLQLPAEFEIGRIGLQHVDFITGLASWGNKEMRTTFCCPINTRS